MLGVSFTIQTNENPEYFASILDYVQRTVESVQTSSGLVDPVKIAILANLYLVDELFSERKKKGDLFAQVPQVELAEAEKIALKLIRDLDSSLQ